jgi:uncharacterized caspase-like protein
VFAGADAIIAACQRSHEAVTSGQNDMFGGMADAPSIVLPNLEPWLPADRLRREYDAIGFFLSGHPLDDYSTALKRLRVQSWTEFSRAVKTGATAGRVAATVVSRMERRTKTGNKMGIIGLSDPTGHFEAVLFSEGLAQYRDVLEPGSAVLMQIGAELQGEDVRARILHAEPLDDAAAKTQRVSACGMTSRWSRSRNGLKAIKLRLSSPSFRPQARRAFRRRWRGHADHDARPADRGGNEAAGQVQGLAADRRGHQGRVGRRGRADGVTKGGQTRRLIPTIIRSNNVQVARGLVGRWADVRICRMRGMIRILNVAAMLVLAAAITPLQAQTPPPPQGQQGRIALVIGNGNYASAPLATAANDAGLIAQTLQAAGFDVVGARDLDGETLRQTFRDFIQKAQKAGPDTVAMIYLSGYGLQLAGENYFAPVDAAMTRDTDVPVEGLRIGDYIRQLSALPLKANIVVLDTAYNSPFAKEGQPLAGGLALMEPEPKGLVAFNAAPGTVAPSPTGNYGPYAQALAEMIRTGGISLPEVFNRTRLRVNDVTKGAQVPWDAQKLEGDFVFFDRAPDAPPLQANQDAAGRSKPIRDFSAQDAYTAALERDTIADYEAFLAAYPDDPMAKRVRAIVAARREAITWRQTYRANTSRLTGLI